MIWNNQLQEHLDHEANAQYDYLSEAYGPTARDAEMFSRTEPGGDLYVPETDEEYASYAYWNALEYSDLWARAHNRFTSLEQEEREEDWRTDVDIPF